MRFTALFLRVMQCLSGIPASGLRVRILTEKNLIEYEEREMTRRGAVELAQLTERFYRWAQSQLNSK